MTQDSLMALEHRIGSIHLQQRLHMQSHRSPEMVGPGRSFFNFDNARVLNALVRTLLRLSGFYGRGYRNFLDIQVRTHSVGIAHLAPSFEGFTILQLSDLHLDLDPTLTPRILQRLEGLEYDVCVITGDYRNKCHGDFQPCLAEMEKLMSHLRPRPAYGILGNHDFIEMVAPLEQMGLQMLLNETVTLERGADRIYLSGVDDPCHYEADNLEKTRQGIPPGAASVLLAHSPSSYRQAAALGYDFMLSGHTHGGQVCLPGGVAILRLGNCPARMLNGSWSYQGLLGYTSPGTGSSGVPVRFHCPPEMTLHRLTTRSPEIP